MFGRFIVGGKVADPPLDISTLNWRRYFDSEDVIFTPTRTWAGRASAGTSSSESAQGGTPAIDIGTPLNGIQTVLFNGTAMTLTNNSNAINATATPTNSFGATSWYYWAVVNWDPTGAPDVTSPNLFYQNQCLLGDQNFRWKMTNRPGNCQIYYYDGALTGVETPMLDSTWQLVQARSDGTLTEIRCGSGAWTPAPRSLPIATAVTGPAALGDSQGSAMTWRGQVASFACGYTWYDDTVSDEILASLESRYALTF